MTSSLSLTTTTSVLTAIGDVRTTTDTRLSVWLNVARLPSASSGRLSPTPAFVVVAVGCGGCKAGKWPGPENGRTGKFKPCSPLWPGGPRTSFAVRPESTCADGTGTPCWIASTLLLFSQKKRSSVCMWMLISESKGERTAECLLECPPDLPVLVVVAERRSDAVQMIAYGDHRPEVHKYDLQDGTILCSATTPSIIFIPFFWNYFCAIKAEHFQRVHKFYLFCFNVQGESGNICLWSMFAIAVTLHADLSFYEDFLRRSWR